MPHAVCPELFATGSFSFQPHAAAWTYSNIGRVPLKCNSPTAGFEEIEKSQQIIYRTPTSGCASSIQRYYSLG